MAESASSGLRLRLLPSVTADSSDALLSKQQLLHQSASCAYLCAEMVAQPAQDERVVCLRWPYRQLWPAALVQSMVKEIRDAERIWQATASRTRGAPLQVTLELYHFLDGWGAEPAAHAKEERARCESICKQGARLLEARLQGELVREEQLAQRRASLPSVAAWSAVGLAARSAPPAAMEKHGICVQLVAVRVGDVAESRHREDQRRCYQEALAASTQHWAQARARLAEMAPPDGGCRAVVLADTSVMARHQATWAKKQSCVNEDKDGRPFEVPLLDADEPVLVLPITGFLPSLQAPNECSRKASGALESVWDPWKEAQAHLPPGARQRVELRVGRRRAAAPAPESENVAAQLHHMATYYSRPQDFRSEGSVDTDKALKAVADFFDKATTTLEERYRLLWFAVVVPERSEDVLDWLKTELEDRVGRPDFDPLCWAVARYWAVAMRTATYRCEGVGAGNDPIRLGDLLMWLDALKVHQSKREQWRDYLRKETLWVGQELRVEEANKGSNRRHVPSSVWRAYSTDDPLQAHAGLSLEMQRRAMEQFDEILDAALRGRHLALDGRRALLLVTGAMARRLFVLSRHVQHFTVMMLNGREAPQGGTNKQVASLCLKRRVVYQFPTAVRQALAEAGEDGEADATTRRLVTSALREVAKHRPGVVCETFQALHARHADPQQEEAEDEDLGSSFSEQSEEALQAVAAVVRRVHEAEARHREALPQQQRARLAVLWERQLTCSLHNAACAVSQGLGEMAPLFLETFLEQLCRASEEPLLRFFASRPAWKQLRAGSASVAYSQHLKHFVREMLMPLCSGPAALQRLLRWLVSAEPGLAAVGTGIVPLMRLGLTARLSRAERMRVDSAVEARSARRPDMPLEPTQRFLDDVAPGHRLWQLEWERRRFLAKAALASFHRQVVMAGALREARAPDWLVVAALAQLPIAAGARHPGGRRAFAAANAPSQHSLLALLRRRGEELVHELRGKTCELGHLAALLPRGGDCDDEATAVQEHGAGEEGNEQASDGQWLEAWENQLDFSEAIRAVRRFLEQHAREQVQRLEPPHAGNLHLSSPLDKLRRGYRGQNQQHNGAFGDHDMEWFLLQAILQHVEEGRDLAVTLEDALDYWHRFYMPADARSREQLGAALRLVQDTLLHHLHRRAGGRLDMEHRTRRRKQVDSFARNQRDIYHDRPRARGVLDSLGHRLKGGSEEVKCWVAEGEVQRPWPRVCRMLASDMYAEAWYCSWLTGPRLPKQHDVSRADTELARHLLCAEADDLLRGHGEERGLWVASRRDGERVVKRVRVGWQPDTSRGGLGRPRCSRLDKYRPGRSAEAKEPALGAHEISQVMLRRLVAHAADTARLACLLREPMENGGESQLALATCPRMKRALEPLTHAVELWPLFLRHVGAERLRACTSDREFRLALARAGSPAPTVTRVAAHRWLQRQGEAVAPDYTLGASQAMLEALARALETGSLPPPLPPSPVWDEREVVGRKRAASSQLPMTAKAAKRLRAFRAQGEEAWFRSQRLAEHFAPDNRAHDWQQQEQRKSHGVPLPCRPWILLSRRIWVEEQNLPMTPHDDAGRLPDLFSLQGVLLHPVVICPRTPGRKLLDGSLPFGQYTRAEHARYVGDMGECILFGADQQTLLRAFKARGLCFLATSQDRVSVLKQVLARSCVLYLLGQWKHFPLFLGEGKSSFPWLGARWQDGILNLQQLVRQQLRQELLALEPQLAPLRSAWRALGQEDAPWRALAQPEALARLREVDPQLSVPPLALRIEALQERALAAAGGSSERPLLERLQRTLADRPDKKEAGGRALLVFPTERHVREAWSTPLNRGGRLMPTSLSKWLEDDHILEALETGAWPALGDGDLREQQPASSAPPRRPLELGQHIVVLPPWAAYVRGLSESAGRGPRDGHAPFECWAEERPPLDEAMHRYWAALREAQAPLGKPLGYRALARLYKRVFPAPRMRTRGGDREEAPEGEPDCACDQELTETRLPSSAVDKPELRRFLQSGHPRHFRVATTVDVRQVRGFRGATQCLSSSELAREARRLGRGRNLHGARYLHGVQAPEGVRCVAAEQVVEAEHRMLIEECASLDDELEEERRLAEARTARELALPRWPGGTAALCGLHGSRAPQSGSSAPPQSAAAVILVAARAADFQDVQQCPPAFARAHPCVALYPPEEQVPTPCYELQLASLRLLERQLLRLYEDRRMLLLAVGADAALFFKSLHLLLRPAVGATDLMALPEESLPSARRERMRLTIAQSLVGWCSVDQLRDEQFASVLCSRPDQEELRLDWIALRSQLKSAVPAAT